MTRSGISSKYFGFRVALLTTALALFACESGGVGDPCIPEDEYQQDFSGFAETEVNIERRSFQCETRICLVNNFRGRVSCPYGQNVPELGEDGIAMGVAHTESCAIPGGEPSEPTDVIEVPVRPQLEARQPDDAVYCSCRCNGSDKNARYCECPSGFRCEELKEIGLFSEQLGGSYCVRSGTSVEDPTTISKQDCSYSDKDCGPSVNAE